MLVSNNRFAALIVAALIIAAIGYFMLANPRSDTAQVDSTATTERVAVAAGARVTPTQPPLKVEPK
jgi:hypothetical protein